MCELSTGSIGKGGQQILLSQLKQLYDSVGNDEQRNGLNRDLNHGRFESVAPFYASRSAGRTLTRPVFFCHGLARKAKASSACFGHVRGCRLDIVLARGICSACHGALAAGHASVPATGDAGSRGQASAMRGSVLSAPTCSWVPETVNAGVILPGINVLRCARGVLGPGKCASCAETSLFIVTGQ